MSDALNILLIDDDEMDRMMVGRAFRQSSLEVQVAEAPNADNAEQLLLDNTFDCILLDYKLAGVDGLDLLRKILDQNLSQAPVIMLSGMEDEELMLECLKSGAQDYLLKSDLNTAVLVRSIRYSQERKQITEQLRFVAQHDSLTGLANRSLFVESVERAIARSRRSNTAVVVFFIDLDNFKSINDSLGHDAGDALLKTIADRINLAVRTEDLVGRLGGDEFAVVMEGLQEAEFSIKIAQHILDVVGLPIPLKGRDIHSTPSIGIATYPTCGDSAMELLKHADMAMYSAKQAGRNGYQFYEHDMQELANEFAELKEDMLAALRRDEFELYYQPQVEADGHKVVAVEALIRWHHPTRGMVAPNDFIPIAEKTGLIKPIGEWVIRRACQQYQEIVAAAGACPRLSVALNVSANQLRQDNLVELICDTAKECGMPLDRLEVELTEHALIQDIERGAQALGKLVEQGIRIAIDDFGTGYASFQHLQQLPVQTLKIDRSFTKNLPQDRTSLELVRAMATMAKALGIQVVAEGVETKEQAIVLKELGCDFLQGYLFAKPRALADLELSSTIE